MASTESDITYDQGGGVTTALATLKDGTTKSATLTSSAATDFVDISKVNRVSVHVVNGASNSVVFTVEGSNTPTAANFKTVAYGEGSSAAYTQAAKTIAASGISLLFLPDADVFKYLRLNISSGNPVGTAATVFGKSG